MSADAAVPLAGADVGGTVSCRVSHWRMSGSSISVSRARNFSGGTSPPVGACAAAMPPASASSSPTSTARRPILAGMIRGPRAARASCAAAVRSLPARPVECTPWRGAAPDPVTAKALPRCGKPPKRRLRPAGLFGRNCCVKPTAPHAGRCTSSAAAPNNGFVLAPSRGSGDCLLTPRHRGRPGATPPPCSTSPPSAHALEQVEGDLGTLDRALSESPDFARMLGSPVLSREGQGRAVGALAERFGLGDIVRNFLGVLAKQRRLAALPAMIGEFRRCLRRIAARRRPRSSRRCRSTRRAWRHPRRGRSYAGRAVKLTAAVDPALLGGLVVRIGSRMIDASLKTKLQNLELSMRGIR